MEQMIKKTHVLFFFGVVLLEISPHRVEGILSSSGQKDNDSMSIEDDAIFVPVNATEQDFLKISSRIRIPTNQAIDEMTPVIIQSLSKDQVISGSSATTSRRVPSYGLPKEAAPITSIHNVRLRMNPASKLNGSPGDRINIEFQLTNLGQESYFAISSEERYVTPSPGQINFPDTSLTHGLSERKAFVRQNETHPIIISLHVPPNARIGTTKEITVEVQPYVNTNTGNTNYLTRRFYFVVDNKNPEEYDFDNPTCSILTDTRADICKELVENKVPCDQRRWNGKFSVQDTGSGLKTMLESSLGLDSFGTSLDLSNTESVYSRDNFIIGTKLPAEFTFGTTCCIDRVTLTVYDLANHQEVCSAGFQAEVQVSSLTITVVVVCIVLVIVLVVAVVSILCIRRRRNAELAEMRSLPQER